MLKFTKIKFINYRNSESSDFRIGLKLHKIVLNRKEILNIPLFYPFSSH